MSRCLCNGSIQSVRFCSDDFSNRSFYNRNIRDRNIRDRSFHDRSLCDGNNLDCSCGCRNNRFNGNCFHINDFLLTHGRQSSSDRSICSGGTIDSGFISRTGHADLSTQERFHAVSSMDAISTPIRRNGRLIFSAGLVDVLLCSCAKNVGLFLILWLGQFVKRIGFFPTFSFRNSFELSVRILSFNL